MELELEQALGRSEERLTQFLDALPVAVVVYGPDTKPRYANQLASKMIGPSQEAEQVIAAPETMPLSGWRERFPIVEATGVRQPRGHALRDVHQTGLLLWARLERRTRRSRTVASTANEEERHQAARCARTPHAFSLTESPPPSKLRDALNLRARIPRSRSNEMATAGATNSLPESLAKRRSQSRWAAPDRWARTVNGTQGPRRRCSPRRSYCPIRCVSSDANGGAPPC